MTDSYQRAQAAYDDAEPDDSEHVECPECGGSGGVSACDSEGEYLGECPRCGGTGEVRQEGER